MVTANYVFAAMRNWHRTAFNLLDAVGKGVSGAEIDWQMGGDPRASGDRFVDVPHQRRQLGRAPGESIEAQRPVEHLVVRQRSE